MEDLFQNNLRFCATHGAGQWDLYSLKWFSEKFKYAYLRGRNFTEPKDMKLAAMKFGILKHDNQI